MLRKVILVDFLVVSASSNTQTWFISKVVIIDIFT